MSTLTNYNVKVALDIANPGFTEDKAVIFDLSENKFVLGEAGSSGITVKSDPASVEVPSATILKFTNGKITAGITGEAVVDSIWFASDTLNFGQIQTPTLGGATAGFTQNGNLAKTHVTPQFSDKRTAFLTIKMDTAETQSALLEYPENFITYGDASLEPGGPADPDDDDDDHTTEPPHTCTGKWKEQTGPTTYIDLDISNIGVGDTLLALTFSIDPFVFTNGGSVTLVPISAPLLNEVNFIVADFDGLAVIGGDYFYTFTVTSVTYDGTTSFSPGAFCVYNNGRRSTILTVGGDSTLGQLSLRSTGSVSPDPRSGLMLTSAPNILFFQPDAKASPSGSFQPISASAAIDFSLADGSLSLKVSGTASASEPPKTVLYVSKSGEEARVGIGTDKPSSTFELKTLQGSSKGSPDLVLSVPSGSVAEGAESSRLSFVIEDQSLSGSKLLTSGSTGAIFSRVLGEEGLFQYGSLVFEVDGPNTNERDYKAIEIGHGLFANDSLNIGIAVSSSIEMGGLDNPRIFIKNTQDENIIKIGNDTQAPSDSNAGELRIFDNDTEKIVFRTYGSADSYINTTGGFGIGTTTPNSKLEVIGDTILSGSLAVSQSFTASGLYYPDIDGTDGQVITTDGAGNLSFQTIEDVYVTVKNVSGGTLYKGTPVHATSSQASGNATPVIAASASNAFTMPATFVLNEQIDDEDEGQALLSGFIQGVDTSIFEVGEVAYVGENGGFTNVKPTGSSNLIQNLGIVTKVHASNGSGWVYGSGRSNDIPNLPTGKIWVGSDSYTVTSSVLSLDETNKYLSGSESAKFKLDTYEFGYNAFQGFGFDVTGSGIIISSSLPSEHYPMLKIGETELIDLTPNAALSNHTFAIHNVDNFQVSSGSEPIETSTNKLFEHTGEAFKIYSKGNTQTILNASSASVDLRGAQLNLLPDSGVTNIKISNSSTTPQYVPVFSSIPNSPAGVELRYVTSSTFTGGGGSSPYSLGTFGGRYSWGSADDNERIAHGFVNGPSAGATQNSGEWGTTIIGTPDSTTFNISNYLIQYHGIWCPVGGTPHIKAWGRSSDADFTTSTSMSVSLWSLDSEPSNGFGSSNVTLRAQTSFLQGQGSTVNYLGNGWETSGSIRPANCFYFVTFDLAGEIASTATLSANFTIWID